MNLLKIGAKTIEENKTSSSCQEIITFKFEMVFEWMIGEFFKIKSVFKR